MCWQTVLVDMLADGLCGVILFELLARPPLFTTIQLCPRSTSGFRSAFLNVKRNIAENKRRR